MSRERNASRLGAATIMEGSWFQASVVGKRICRRRVMLILEYISTHGTPEWCAARMSARESKGRLPAYEQPCTSCIGACWLYAWREGPTPAG